MLLKTLLLSPLVADTQAYIKINFNQPIFTTLSFLELNCEPFEVYQFLRLQIMGLLDSDLIASNMVGIS